MSVHKNAILLLILLGMYLLLLKQNFDNMKWTFYASGTQIQSFIIMAALNLVWLLQLLPYLIWLIRRRNVTSPRVLKLQANFTNASILMLFCAPVSYTHLDVPVCFFCMQIISINDR